MKSRLIARAEILRNKIYLEVFITRFMQLIKEKEIPFNATSGHYRQRIYIGWMLRESSLDYNQHIGKLVPRHRFWGKYPLFYEVL